MTKVSKHELLPLPEHAQRLIEVHIERIKLTLNELNIMRQIESRVDGIPQKETIFSPEERTSTYELRCWELILEKFLLG